MNCWNAGRGRESRRRTWWENRRSARFNAKMHARLARRMQALNAPRLRRQSSTRDPDPVRAAAMQLGARGAAADEKDDLDEVALLQREALRAAAAALQKITNAPFDDRAHRKALAAIRRVAAELPKDTIRDVNLGMGYLWGKNVSKALQVLFGRDDVFAGSPLRTVIETLLEQVDGLDHLAEHLTDPSDLPWTNDMDPDIAVMNEAHYEDIVDKAQHAYRDHARLLSFYKDAPDALRVWFLESQRHQQANEDDEKQQPPDDVVMRA